MIAYPDSLQGFNHVHVKDRETTTIYTAFVG